MPLKHGTSRKVIAANIAEFHHGPTFARTAATHGKAAANKQAVAVAMRMADESRRRRGAKSSRRTIAHGD